ncbi:MAG TPA: hypothetical protein VKX17_18890 [Planctomycetota bacterium]|nr:hypothetical protein [Planctomycetota bacterium]
MADAAQIENRVLYWLANDSTILSLYRAFDAGTGKDPYCASAEILRGKPVAGKKENPSEEDKSWRNVGKVCEIALGYQMGTDAFADRCSAEEIDLSKVGLTPKECLEKWRQNHPSIAGPRGIWRLLECGIEAVVKDGKPRQHLVDGTSVMVTMNDRNLYIGLPSGRHLVYRNARMSASLKFPWKQQVTYDSPVGISQLYGGLITENIVQAIAADCFRFWILSAEMAGLKVIGHTHDEIIIEALEQDLQSVLELIKSIMKTPPPWAWSLPVNADPDSHVHYKK